MKTIKQQMMILEYIKFIVLTILSILILTNFVFQLSVVPSGSMIPTIQEGDRIIINRLPLYYKDPVRGDIVVFDAGEEYMVKRVIGMGGEEIDIRGGKVYINGTLLDESAYLDKMVYTDPNPYYKDERETDIEYPYIIPEGTYFLMGDNRDASMDSRYYGTWSREDLFAISHLRIWPLNRIGIVK